MIPARIWMANMVMGSANGVVDCTLGHASPARKRARDRRRGDMDERRHGRTDRDRRAGANRYHRFVMAASIPPLETRGLARLLAWHRLRFVFFASFLVSLPMLAGWGGSYLMLL